MEKSLLSGLFFAIIGAIGALVHGVLTAATLPVQLNHFWGLWFSLWLLFAGEQILIIRQACRNNLQKHVKVNMLYFLLVAIASFISFLCFCTCTGFSEKIGLVWSLFVTIANLWAIYILNSEFPKIHPETGTNRKCCKPCSTVCCLITLNDVIKVFHLLLSIALCAGAIVCAYSESFKPRGTIVQAVQSNENTISMHYICIGPKNVTSTVWIVADVTHGVAEFYGMSQYLATTKRVCTYDPPGTGWSSEIRSDTFAYEADLFASVVQLSNEILPIDLIGWVGGGQVILKYNSKYPQNVKSLIFQSAYPPEIEFIYSDASTSKRASELNARKSITSILLGLAIPWGLMPIFISGNQSSYVPQDRYWEYRVQLWKSKTWKGQGDGLDYMIANDGRNDLAYYNNVSAPLTAIVCGNFGACQSWQSSSDCVKANTSFQFYLNQSLVWYQKLQPTVKVIYNPDPVCRTNLEWFDPYIANITAGILS